MTPPRTLLVLLKYELRGQKELGPLDSRFRPPAAAQSDGGLGSYTPSPSPPSPSPPSLPSPWWLWEEQNHPGGQSGQTLFSLCHQHPG